MDLIRKNQVTASIS